MKTFLICCCLLSYCTLLPGQLTFDPDIDTIATCNKQGVWKIIKPDNLLIASAQAAFPALTEVQGPRIQGIHSSPYLFFRGKHRAYPGSGYTVMIQLLEGSKGIWKTGEVYQACWGSNCATCGFDEYWGCSCERSGGDLDEYTESYCNHMIALGRGLVKIEIQD